MLGISTLVSSINISKTSGVRCRLSPMVIIDPRYKTTKYHIYIYTPATPTSVPLHLGKQPKHRPAGWLSNEKRGGWDALYYIGADKDQMAIAISWRHRQLEKLKHLRQWWRNHAQWSFWMAQDILMTLPSKRELGTKYQVLPSTTKYY